MRRFLAVAAAGWLLIVPVRAADAYDANSASSAPPPSQRPQWIPSLTYEEDNYDREHWTFEHTATWEPTPGMAWWLTHAWTDFREQGVDTVTGHAAGMGMRRTVASLHDLSGQGMFHAFSSDVEEMFSGFLRAKSRWASWFHTDLVVGQEPAETARALRERIRERFVELAVRWEPITHWFISGRGELRRLSDDNRRYTTEWEIARDLRILPGLQAVYTLTTDNMVERRPAYYSPHRVMLHRVGFAYYGEPTSTTWIWGRYLIGYGEEREINTWRVHAVDMTGGVRLTQRWNVTLAFSWSKAPTYRSTEGRFGFTCQF